MKIRYVRQRTSRLGSEKIVQRLIGRCCRCTCGRKCYFTANKLAVLIIFTIARRQMDLYFKMAQHISSSATGGHSNAVVDIYAEDYQIIFICYIRIRMNSSKSIWPRHAVNSEIMCLLILCNGKSSFPVGTTSFCDL